MKKVIIFVSTMLLLVFQEGHGSRELKKFTNNNFKIRQAIHYNRVQYYNKIFITKLQQKIGSPVTGSFDRNTVIAIAGKQKKLWFPVNGMVTYALRRKLRLNNWRKIERRIIRLSRKRNIPGNPDEKFDKQPSGWNKKNDKSIYFLFGYRSAALVPRYLHKAARRDNSARKAEFSVMRYLMEYAFNVGIRVVYVPFALRKDLLEAFKDPTAAGIVWSGHGYQYGVLQFANGRFFVPLSINAYPAGRHRSLQVRAGRRFRCISIFNKPVKTKLSFLVLASCRSGQMRYAWRRLLGTKPYLKTWFKPTTASVAVHYFSLNEENERLLDLIRGLERK